MHSSLRHRALLAGTATCLVVGAAVGVAQADQNSGTDLAPATGQPSGTPLVSTLRIDPAPAPTTAPAVHLTVRNTSAAPVDVLRWDLPGLDAAPGLLAVSRDGQTLPYRGRLVKRAAPQPGDYVHLDAGATYTTTVDLAGGYDLSRPGTYRVKVARTRARLRPATPGSAPLPDAPAVGVQPGTASFSTGTGVPVSGTAARGRRRPGTSTGTGTGSNSGTGSSSGSGSGSTGGQVDASATTQVSGVTITFRGCSSARQSALRQAVSDAATYSRSASSWLASHPTGGGAYATWFGTYSSSRFSHVTSAFSKISGELTGQRITLDCTSSENYYAYVYPDDAYTIYICTGYWSAPARGYDSKAGTLIHESSHFYVNGGAEDHVYGLDAGRRLAASNPEYAVRNADNIEHFAEGL